MTEGLKSCSESLPREILKGRTWADPFSYVRAMFAPLPVTGLHVPGSVKGQQTISVSFQTGGSVQVTGDGIEDAWRQLRIAAETLGAAPARSTEQSDPLREDLMKPSTKGIDTPTTPTCGES